MSRVYLASAGGGMLTAVAVFLVAGKSVPTLVLMVAYAGGYISAILADKSERA